MTPVSKINRSTTICNRTRSILYSTQLPISPNVIYKGKVVLCSQGSFLLGQETGGSNICKEVNNNKYNIIGGTCNKHESIIACAARETCEETLGLVNQQTLESVLSSLPNQCILSYIRNRKEYGRYVTQYIFVFFVPLESVFSSSANHFVSEFHKRRSEYLKNPSQFVQKHFCINLGKSLNSQFNEIANVKWFSICEMKKENINTFFYNKIQHIECPQYNETYSFDHFAKLVHSVKISRVAAT